MAVLYPRFNRAASALRADRLARELDKLREVEGLLIIAINGLAIRLEPFIGRSAADTFGEQMAEVLEDAISGERKQLESELAQAEREAGDEL